MSFTHTCEKGDSMPKIAAEYGFADYNTIWQRPENDALRKRHAPLKDFVAGTCATPLLYSPGTSVKYQSMGVLLAAEVVQRITARPLARGPSVPRGGRASGRLRV